MFINPNKLIFSFLIFLTTFYAAVSSTDFKLSKPQKTSLSKTSKKYTNILKTKILLDFKYKAKPKLLITKELASISIDKEGKILGYKNITLIKDKKHTYINNNNQELKKSTLWGTMKLIKV